LIPKEAFDSMDEIIQKSMETLMNDFRNGKSGTREYRINFGNIGGNAEMSTRDNISE
jgi:hypothetical protein